MAVSQEWLMTAENLYPFTPQGELASLQFSFLNRKAEVMIAEISLWEKQAMFLLEEVIHLFF